MNAAREWSNAIDDGYGQSCQTPWMCLTAFLKATAHSPLGRGKGWVDDEFASPTPCPSQEGNALRDA